MKRNFNSRYFFSIVWRVTMVLMMVFHTGVAPTKADLQPVDLLHAMVSWAELQFCIVNNACSSLAEDYSLNNVKHLGYITVDIEGVIPSFLSAQGTIFFDLDDYARITAEGQQGYITTWADMALDLGVSITLLPVGMGVIRINREYGIDDPSREFGIKLTSFNIGAWEVTGIHATTDGTIIGEASLGNSISLGGNWTLLGVNFNLLRFELHRDYLNRSIRNGIIMAGAGPLASGQVAKEIFFHIFNISSASTLELNFLPNVNEIKRFTSLDSGEEWALDGMITSAIGGQDVTGDNRPDNHFPTSYYWDHLYVNLTALSTNPLHYYMKMVSKPDGWYVWANDNDFSFHGNDDRYDVGVLANGMNGEADWLVQNKSGVESGIIVFELWVDYWEGLLKKTKYLTTFSVPVKRLPYTDPSSAPIINVSPATRGYSGQDLTISASIQDSDGISDAWLFYLHVPGTWTRVDMQNIGGTQYQATIPGLDVQPPEMLYYIAARDGILISYTEYSGVDILPPLAITNVAITPNKTQYDPGETVILNVSLEDNDNLRVSGASLSYSINDTTRSCNETGISCSDLGNGNYTISFPAPSAIRDYPVEVTTSKPGYVSGTGATTITVYAPFEVGHDADLYFFIAEKAASQVRAQANVRNNGTYAGTGSETIRIVYRLKDPSGVIVATDSSQVFTLAKNAVGYSIGIYLNDPGGFKDGQYIVEAEAEIVGKTDQNPANNKQSVSLWYGDRPTYNEYGLHQTSAAGGAITSPVIDGYTLQVVSINTTYKYAYINVFNYGTSVSDCQLERAYLEEILTCDNNNLAIVLNVITSGGSSAWFYLGKANNTGVTFTPGTAVTPAGLDAAFRVTGPVGVDLREFNVEYAGVDDDFSIVSAWKLTTRRNQPNDWNVSLRVPSATTPRTYNFWMAFNDNNSSFNRIIKKLAVEVQPPHNIVIPSITPNNQALTVGAVVPISVTVQNSGGYTEYGLNALLTITGPNGYIQTFNNPITSLSSGSSTNRTINWSTGGLSAGTYTIKGEVPLSLDAYPADNTRTVTNTLSTPPALIANASTDKNNYQQNESISLSVNVTANNSAVSGATVTYFMKDSSHQTVSSGQLADQENGFYTLNLSAPLSVDLYSITVTATKSGYINGTIQLTEISVTKAPPETTLLTASPSDGDLINYNDLGFEWIGTDLSVPSNLLEYSYKLDSNPWSSFSPSTSVFFSDIAEGLHTFYVKTRTTNGLEDLTPASRSFTVDTQAPIFETHPAPDAAIYSNTDTIRVQIDLDGPATVNASFNTIDSHFSPHNIVVLETNASTHRYSISYPISANNTNSDNSYSINIYALDAAGNTRTASLSVRLDNYPPTILAKNPDDGEEAITGTAISVLFSEPMNKAATESAFSIQPSLTGSFAWMGNQLIFAPGASLQCETDYLIQLSPSAIDFAGKPISLTSWQFSTGSCSYPEIDLRWQDNNASIPSGESMPSVSNGTDFGNVNIINNTLSRTYQIFNLGNASLSLTGNPSVGISGTNAADFAISQPASSHVAPGSSTSFTVVFNPSQVGTRLATLSIPNNDPNENPYTFKIEGTGISTSPPGDFAKTAPATGSTNQPDSLTLNWQTSSYATRYEYCSDTTNDNACSTWIDVGDSTSTGIGGLDYDSTYYWQVRAWNGAIGPIYANQGAFWSFTTQEQLSNLVFADDFSSVKAWLDESNGNIYRDSTNDWLAWTVTRAQTRRFYALTDVPSNDVDMSFRFQLSSVLGNGSIYFGLAEDLDGSLHNPTFPTGFFLMVGTYAQLKIVYPHITYTDDYPNSWNPDDTSTYLNFGSLGLWRQCDVVIKDGQWRVQLLDENGGLLDEISGTLPKAHSRYNYFMVFLDEVGGWETTSGLFDELNIRIQPPGAFDKSNPLPEATGVSTSPILSWSPSSGVNNYEYCLDTTDDNACSNWIRTAGTTAKFSGLSANTSYYWQVRASNPGGITYANGSSTTYWSFTTQPVQQQPPGAFNKRDPFDLTSGVPVSLLLRWDSSSGAERYEYCYDATDDQACSNWIDVGTNTSVSVGPLKYSTHYTWQVRATNSAGVTYADDSQSASWSFITRQIDSPITPGGNKIYLPFLS